MSTRSRFERSMFAGAVTGLALTVLETVSRPAALAAAAKSAAHGHHLTPASVLAAAFAVTTAVVGLVIFTVASLIARKRAGRALLAGTRRSRGYGGSSGGYSPYGDQW